MEESPPPAPPPKDVKVTPYTNDDGRPSTAPTSGSKRKRDGAEDNTYIQSSGHLDDDGPTPNKRTRSVIRHGEASASEDATPSQPRGVRRKKGLRNLSNLNLRHAAQQQDQHQRTLSHESKFQEGSLTDKPSEKPPSLYTRGASRDVDELMEDYHNGVPTPRKNVDGIDGYGRQSNMQYQTEMDVEDAKQEGTPGFFQFGRQWAASFHPGALWRKIWSEPKEDIVAQQHVEEVRRKAKQKAEAEARYAEMKKAGKLGLQPVGLNHPGVAEEIETPRDSGIEFDGSDNHSRSVSQMSGQLQPADSESEAPDTTSRPSGLKARPHFKKPSLTNIKAGLKRVGSDLNLSATLRGRESSSSLSPVKTDFDNSALRKSESRYDLKKQQKLSKRVSDLESKLIRARLELNEAFVEASPAPKLTGKFERFTPSATIEKRQRFTPGKLPSLPSERILMAEQALAASRATRDEMESEPRKAIDLTDAIREDEVNDDDTIKASREGKRYPTRASSLFQTDNKNSNTDQNVNEPTTIENTSFNSTHDIHIDVKSKLDEVSNTENMDPNSITSTPGEAAAQPREQPSYAALDAKLKALDANVKLARKPRKRKSAAADDDKLFKPGKGDLDDDDEWEDADRTPKKKRRSTGGGSPPAKRSGSVQVKAVSPKAKKGSNVTVNLNGVSASPKNKSKSGIAKPAESHDEEIQEEVFSADEGDAEDADADEGPSQRTSIDATEIQPLDIVYEEEEEHSTSKVPLNDEPSKPTAKATPARHPRSGGFRSRSHSPHKRKRSVESGVEEQMFTRAAEAVKQHPGRKKAARSVSPPPPISKGHASIAEEDKPVSVTPGAAGVPKLPKGATGSFESLVQEETETVIMGTEVLTKRKTASFEWPEDVF